MEDFEDEDPVASERQLMGNEWRRLNEGIEKDGFHEGYEQAIDKARQEGFDTGYKQSFDVFEDYGQLNGLFVVLATKNPQNEEIKELDGLLKELRTKLEEEADHDPEAPTDSSKDPLCQSIELSASTKTLFLKIKEHMIRICQDLQLSELVDVINQCGSQSAIWSSAS